MSKQVLNDLSLETFLELVDSTEEVTNTGMWILDLASGTVIWSNGTYRIHEFPLTTPITLELAASFYSKESLPLLMNTLELAKETVSEKRALLTSPLIKVERLLPAIPLSPFSKMVR